MRVRLGGQGGKTAWFNFFLKPFGAASFSEFWRLWNPVYGYFLRYYCFRPLSRVLPRPAALLTTFVLCGFCLHDLPAWAVTRRVLPPGATIAFMFFGLGVLISEALGMDLSRRPVAAGPRPTSRTWA
jgi:D-alanyl-lipoteichoic acid acyltransferase DltB (MBOAT superfamily)